MVGAEGLPKLPHPHRCWRSLQHRLPSPFAGGCRLQCTLSFSPKTRNKGRIANSALEKERTFYQTSAYPPHCLHRNKKESNKAPHRVATPAHSHNNYMNIGGSMISCHSCINSVERRNLATQIFCLLLIFLASLASFFLSTLIERTKLPATVNLS